MSNRPRHKTDTGRPDVRVHREARTAPLPEGELQFMQSKDNPTWKARPRVAGGKAPRESEQNLELPDKVMIPDIDRSTLWIAPLTFHQMQFAWNHLKAGRLPKSHEEFYGALKRTMHFETEGRYATDETRVRDEARNAAAARLLLAIHDFLQNGQTPRGVLRSNPTAPDRRRRRGPRRKRAARDASR